METLQQNNLKYKSDINKTKSSLKFFWEKNSGAMTFQQFCIRKYAHTKSV